MNYAVPPCAPIAVPITNPSDLFPINRIYCIARNYEAQPRPVGSVADRDAPFFFAKDADAYAPNGSTIPYQPNTSNVFHEVELVVAIGKPEI